MYRTPGSMSLLLVRLALLALLLPASPVFAQDSWIEPEGWARVGPVSDWMTMDTHFYRIESLVGTQAYGQLDVDQKKAYQDTRRHRHALPRVTLDQFLALPAAEREERAAAAVAALKPVESFRYRIRDLVARVQTRVDNGWGKQTGDHTAVGDMITHLHTAVGLDPSNPYPWHLLAYFTGVAGDLDRSLLAMEGLDAALALLPADALPEMRRRAHLDTAWLLREVGDPEGATEQVAAAAAMSDDLESRLLQGLLAAQAGDLQTARECAAAVGSVDVGLFQREWFNQAKVTMAAAVLDPLAWPTRPNGYLGGWIMALTWLQDGRPDMARKALDEISIYRYYPLGHRFWNEAAAIYEITGRTEMATKAWGMAQLCTPYYPYLVFKPYGLDLTGVTGREGDVPFVLAYDSFLLCGSRLAYGTALVSQAAALTDRDEQVEKANMAVTELHRFRTKRLDDAAASLSMAYAHGLLGAPFAMLSDANTALAAIGRPGADQGLRAAALTLRETALAALQLPGMNIEGLWSQSRLPWSASEDPAAIEQRLREAHAADPADGAARRDLASFLIRHGDPEAGVALALQPINQDPRHWPATEDLVLILEVDRLRNEPARAQGLLAELKAGRAERWPDARLWVLVGFICMDQGVAEGRLALDFARTQEPHIPELERFLAMNRP